MAKLNNTLVNANALTLYFKDANQYLIIIRRTAKVGFGGVGLNIISCSPLGGAKALSTKTANYNS